MFTATMATTQDRLKDLLAKSAELARNDELQKAADALKEASHLDPDNDEVRTAIRKLSSDGSGIAVDLIRKYLHSKQADDGERALRAVRQKPLPGYMASDVVNLMLKADDSLKLCDPLTSTILTQNTHARKDMATRFTENVIDLFEQLYNRGDDSFAAFAGISLDEKAWESQEQQQKAQVDIFQLSVAKLIEAGTEKPERAMRAISRQLATSSQNVKDAIDEDVFEVVLECLDIRLPPSLRSQSILATSKLLEIKGETGEGYLSSFITSRVAKQTSDELVLAFSVAAAVFPIVPVTMAKLFMTDGFVQQLVPNLERNSTAVAEGKLKSQRLEYAALELLNAACVDKNCREAIDRYCSSWLSDLTEDRQGTHKALSALVLAKIHTGSELDGIVVKLSTLVIEGSKERDQAIEGLAFTSLQPKVKEEIIKNAELVKTLIEAASDRPSAIFGCLTVFFNLTAYRPVITEEQKKMSQLKAYAASQKPKEADPLDDDTYVTSRCRTLLDANIIPALVTCCKQSTSTTSIAMVVQTLLALAKEQKHRSKMSQQSAIRLLLQIKDRITKTDKSTSDAAAIERDASHALARLLISVNPAHVFSGGLPASSAVSALLPLLSTESESDTRDLLPTFEALLGLTNLASMEDNSIRDLVIRSAWTRIEDLMLALNALVQRANVELLCNLMASPSCVSKFADGSKDAKRRMQVLLALADAHDLPTRRAAGGALAMLTEWDAAVTAILDKDRGVKLLLGMCGDDTDEVRHRGFVCVGNVISAPGEVGKRAMEAVKADAGAEALKDALRKSRDPEVLAVGVEVLKKLNE
ncbi:ARM repeat-containing protein [Polychaeton citri CBS 116435]|uniref:ARM repeat-containing protein n=1 Tax=Polychaeton citri CBS 116435 TaxID=1314669 RepID=A0A9P4Q3Y7_9PEZI|nr:ARM repeat-containing protein [Polychaeton citri CBS 116435]